MLSHADKCQTLCHHGPPWGTDASTTSQWGGCYGVNPVPVLHFCIPGLGLPGKEAKEAARISPRVLPSPPQPSPCRDWVQTVGKVSKQASTRKKKYIYIKNGGI